MAHQAELVEDDCDELDLEREAAPSTGRFSSFSLTGRNERVHTNTLWSEVDADVYTAFRAHGATLPSGTYQCVIRHDCGVCLRKVDSKNDELVSLPDGITDDLIEEANRFWSAKEEFHKYGFLHKRGFLLAGPPGSGKTSLVNRLSNHVRENLNGLVLLVTEPARTQYALSALRQVEPERPVLGIIEDIEATLDNGGEEHLLGLLDGKTQIEHVLWVATTNFPERLDARIIARPSRFDRIHVVPPPSAAMRREYLRSHVPDSAPDDLEHLVALSEDFSIAHLKELILSVKCLGEDPEHIAARLRSGLKTKPSSRHWQTRGVGFAPPEN